MTIHWMIS